MLQLTTARGPRTILVGLMLAGIYFGYSKLTAPWLEVPRTAVTHPGAAQPTFGPQEASDVDAARALFKGDDAWVGTALKWFRDGNRYAFFNESEETHPAADPQGTQKASSGSRSVRVSPVAFVWIQENGEEPLTVTASEAQLEVSSVKQSETRNKPSTMDTGWEQEEFTRIVSGKLRGPTRIQGADGLLISGGQFNVTEESMKIWSSQPVTMRWQQNHIRAESGIDIHLLSSGDSSKGLQSVSDVQSLQLNGRVICNLQLPSKNKLEALIPLDIEAPNGFEYQVQTRIASFFGILSQKKQTLSQQIHVSRRSSGDMVDELYCSQLTLQLRPRASLNTARRQKTPRLEVASILAQGGPVRFQSAEHDLTALARNLRYTIDTKTMELWNDGLSAEGRPFPVVIRQTGSEARTPRIRIVQSESGDLQSLECIGQGTITHSGKGPADAVSMKWQQSFLFRQSPDQRILITGGATVTQPEKGFELSGESIEMSLLPGVPEPSTNGVSADTADGHSTAGMSMNLSRLRPDVLTARNGVRLTFPQISGLLREQLVVRFVNRDPGQKNGSVHGISSSQVEPNGGKGSESSEQDAPKGFTTFESENAEVVVLNADPSTEASPENSSSPPGLSNVWLKGGVSIEYTATDPRQSFKASGNVLVAKSGFDGGRDMSLFGDPATVVSTTRRRVEGQRIDLNELDRAVTVPGSGLIRMVMDRGLDRKPLETPTPLDIYWSERMTISGQVARFVGNVRAVMKDKDGKTQNFELTCDGMQVHFSGDIMAARSAESDGSRSLLLPKGEQPKSSGRSSPDIETIRCESLVRLTIEQFTDGVVSSRHKAEFTDLNLNLHTGDFDALGPGWVESTQPDRGNRKVVAQEVRATANRRARPAEESFAFLRATFIDSVKGNVKQKFVRLDQHVSAVYGAVARLEDRIDVGRLDTAELPSQAGILHCEQLTVTVTPGTTDDPGSQSFSLVAEKLARLRSQRFSGDADQITYDHAKKQFVLVAEKGHSASVSHRRDDTGNNQNFSGRRFEYYPAPRNKLIAVDIDRVASGTN